MPVPTTIASVLRAVGVLASVPLLWAPPCAAADAAWLSSPGLKPPPRGESSRGRPVFVSADALQMRPDQDAVASGHVEFRQAGTVIRADRITYDSASDRARATGSVQVRRAGNVFTGPELQLTLRSFEGFFLQPEFELGLLGSGGSAERVDFLDESRSTALRARYSSCTRDGAGQPDWLLQAERVHFDLDAQQGRAEGAVLRFLQLPILALPVLSFPLSDDRKSGWLPPDVGLDSRSGFELAVPYYWNIAPNRDATFTPTLRTRRGLSLQTEYRYLEARDGGRIVLDLLPDDRVAGRSRHAWELQHDGHLAQGLRYRALVHRVSDDGYWKDFPHLVPATSPRLLPTDLQAERDLDTPLGPLTAYARAQRWQVLQTVDAATTIVSPYQRSPQLGLRLAPALPLGLKLGLESELNRFTLPDDLTPQARPTGWRWHTLGQLSRPWSAPGWWLTPKLSFNDARYALDQRASPVRDARRTIPSFSVDAGLVFERETRWFGQPQRQTLEPRLLYVNTPFRDQSSLPNFDSADREFNLVSLFGESAFTGVDRVSDAHQLTLGLTTRFFERDSGAQTLRLALGQRVLFRDRRVTSDGVPFTQRLSDVLLEGSTALVPRWHLDAAVQYNPDARRVVRSIVNARYSPGPFQTVSAGYRFTRGLSEQFELGWQWPVYHGTARPVGASSGCGGTLYGVGRVNYSMRDSRITESILGLEYDAGCWVGRIVSQRRSTGPTEATTRLMLQLELVGLSRLGSNSLQVLKDNVPGYQLLREPRSAIRSDADRLP